MQRARPQEQQQPAPGAQLDVASLCAGLTAWFVPTDQIAALATYDDMPVMVLDSILPGQQLRIIVREEPHKR